MDKIKQSAVASNWVFVVEVMGGYCGYLALLGAIATGAERVYLHEDDVRLRDLQRDVDELQAGFAAGKRLGLMLRNENASAHYTTDFLRSVFAAESGDLDYDVYGAVLGHLQQGGDPQPFDRIMAARMAAKAVEYIDLHAGQRKGPAPALCLGHVAGEMRMTPLDEVMRMADRELKRPREQWWLRLRPLSRMMAHEERVSDLTSTPLQENVRLPTP